MEFYREGFLNKAGKGLIQTHLHSWRPRYFVLNGFQLKYYKSKEQLPENMLGCIELSEIDSVGLLKNVSKAFQITTKPPKPRTYFMSGQSQSEVQVWIDCISKAKEKCCNKENNKIDNAPIPSIYDEINLPAINPSPPNKLQRSYIVSGSGFLDPPTSPSSLASPSTTQPVFGEYSMVGLPQNQASLNDLDQDPTYATVSETAVPQNKQGQMQDQLYDTVTPVSKKNSSAKTSNTTPNAIVPPPLPARSPSMSGDAQQATSLEILQNETQENKDNKKLDGLYDEVFPAASVQENKTSESVKEFQTCTINVYDEIGTPLTAANEEMQNENHQSCNVGLYDEVTITGDTKIDDKKTKTDEIPKVEPSHVYARPQKSAKETPRLEVTDGAGIYSKLSRSMDRNQSKRKLIVGLMDVGEVGDDIEQEAAMGKERMKKGMTQPMGDRFAIEDLREVLAEYDLEMNNNDCAPMIDFDVSQSDSAFEVLSIFLANYE